jgi:hypothetical protein
VSKPKRVLFAIAVIAAGVYVLPATHPLPTGTRPPQPVVTSTPRSGPEQWSEAQRIGVQQRERICDNARRAGYTCDVVTSDGN